MYTKAIPTTTQRKPNPSPTVSSSARTSTLTSLASPRQNVPTCLLRHASNYCFSTSSPPPRSSRRPSVVVGSSHKPFQRGCGWCSEKAGLFLRGMNSLDITIIRMVVAFVVGEPAERLLPLARRFVPEPVRMSYIWTHPGGITVSSRSEWPSVVHVWFCLLYTSPSPRDATLSRMPSSA